MTMPFFRCTTMQFILILLTITVQLCAVCEAQSDFKIAAPVSGADFDILSGTPEPTEMRGFSASSSAHDRLLRSFGKITGISYTDSISGVDVSFSGSMVGLSNGATGSTTSGGKHMGTSVAGTTGKGGFGLGIGLGIGTNIPGIGAGGGAVGSTGNAAFSSHTGKSKSRSNAALRLGRDFSVAQVESAGKKGSARSVHGRSAKNTGEDSTAAGGTGIGGASVATGNGSGGVSMGTGTELYGKDKKVGKNLVGATGGTAASGAISSGIGGTISLAKGTSGGGKGSVNNTAGNPGRTAGAVAAGESVAVGYGREQGGRSRRQRKRRRR